MTFRELQAGLDGLLQAYIESTEADLEKLFGASVILRNAAHGLAVTAIDFGLDTSGVDRANKAVAAADCHLWADSFGEKKEVVKS